MSLKLRIVLQRSVPYKNSAPPKIIQSLRILFGTEGLQFLRLICYDKRNSEKRR